MAEYLYNTWGPRSSRAMVLGDTTPELSGGPLSVKAYKVSGVTVWGSYNSPETNQVLTLMKGQINRFGAKLDYNGLIGPKTVDAIKKINAQYPSQYSQLLTTFTAGGPQMVALQGRSIWNAMARIANDAGLKTSAEGGPSGGGENGPATIAARPPSSSGGGGGVIQPYDPSVAATSVTGMLNNMSDTTKMVLGGGFVLAAFLVARGGKRAGGKKGRR